MPIYQPVLNLARFCLELPRHTQKIIFFGNWFSMLDLILYLKDVGIHAVGTIRQNWLHGCPLISWKDLSKQERGSGDYGVDKNLRIVVVKWLDNSIVHLVPNCIGVERLISGATKVRSWKLFHAPKLFQHTITAWAAWTSLTCWWPCIT